MARHEKPLLFSDAALNIENGGENSDKYWKCLKEVENIIVPSRRKNDHRVRIATLDSGIDLKHPTVEKLLQEEGWDGHRRVVSKSFVDSVEEGVDRVGHGTHIAVTVMSIATWAEVYVASVVDLDGSVREETLEKAILHSINEDEWDVDIISLSLGFPKRPKLVTNAIKAALEKEKLVFAAVSNNGGASITGIAWPAKETKVFGVFSSDFDGERSRFNPAEDQDDTFSRYKFLGESVKSAWPASLGSEEKRMSGTSVATPIAAATAALFIEYIRQHSHGYSGYAKVEMAEMEHYAKLPDGMRRIFAEIGIRKAQNDFLKYITPWHLINTTWTTFSILDRIHRSLRDLQVEHYQQDIQSIEENNRVSQMQLSSHRDRLQHSSDMFQIEKNAIRDSTLATLGFSAVGAGAVGLVAFPVKILFSGVIIALVWNSLAPMREDQGKAILGSLQRAENLKEDIEETIVTCRENVKHTEKVLIALILLILRIIDYQGCSGDDDEANIAANHSDSDVEQPAKLFKIVGEGVPEDKKLESLINTLKKKKIQHAEHAAEVLANDEKVREIARNTEEQSKLAKSEAEARRQKALEDLAEKAKKEGGGTLEWLRWFMLWLGVAIAAIPVILALLAL